MSRDLEAKVEDLLDQQSELVQALKAFCDLYTMTWDLASGGLMMEGRSVALFEVAHKHANQLIEKITSTERSGASE